MISSIHYIIPYFLESNRQNFLQFQSAKESDAGYNCVRIRFMVMSSLWKNDRAVVRAVRTTQYYNLLFIICIT